MTEGASSRPLSWRVPPQQTALLLLVTTGCAALNLYTHPSGALRALTIALGVASLCCAIAYLRMYLVADDEGVGVRFVGREQWLEWSDVDGIEVVTGVRGSATVRLRRRDGSTVDVPPSLLQPVRPTRRPVALRQLEAVARQLEARRAAA